MARNASSKGRRERDSHGSETAIAKEKITIGLCVAIAAVLVIMEGYVMIHYPDQFILMGFLIIPLAIDIYVIVNSSINISLINKKKEQEKFDELYRAEKASYLIIKKSFDELHDRLSVLEENLEDRNAIPADDIINAQKAVAKVTISRNKENAMALLDANNMLIEEISALEKRLHEANQEIKSQQEQMLGSTREDLMKRNQDLEHQLTRLEDTLRTVSLQQPTPMPQFYAQPINMVMPGQQMPMQSQSPVSPQPMQAQAPVMPDVNPSVDIADKETYESGIESDDIASLLMEEGNDGADIENADIDASDIDISEETGEEEAADIDIDLDALLEESSEEADIPEDNSDAEADINLEADIETDQVEADIDLEADIEADQVEADIETEADKAEDTVSDIDLEAVLESADETEVAEEAAEPEMLESVPDIAEMEVTEEAPEAEASAELEPVSEEVTSEDEAASEPTEPTDEAAVEPMLEPAAAPAPELSADPNHKMTPEEIAAMFAAAGGGAEEPASEPAPEEAVVPETEAAPEAEPVPEEIPSEEKAAPDVAEPAAESAPAGPDLAELASSDPNKIMSPEEIEKLFANL